jgi:hypothetical protein
MYAARLLLRDYDAGNEDADAEHSGVMGQGGRNASRTFTLWQPDLATLRGVGTSLSDIPDVQSPGHSRTFGRGFHFGNRKPGYSILATMAASRFKPGPPL